MGVRRVERLNSLLREVITEVLTKDVRNPDIHPLTTISRVDITKDLRHAKVYVSILATDQEKKQTLAALHKASGFISYTASKKVVMRYFPELSFKLDETVDKQMEIDNLLAQIQQEREARQADEPPA